MELRFTERAKQEPYTDWLLSRHFPDARFEMDPNSRFAQSVTLVHGGVRHEINLIRDAASVIDEIAAIIHTDAVRTRMCCDPTPLGAQLEDVTTLGPYYPYSTLAAHVRGHAPSRWAEKYIL